MWLGVRDDFRNWLQLGPAGPQQTAQLLAHHHDAVQRLAEVRRVPNQAANAAVKAKGTIFAIVWSRRQRGSEEGANIPRMGP